VFFLGDSGEATGNPLAIALFCDPGGIPLIVLPLKNQRTLRIAFERSAIRCDAASRNQRIMRNDHGSHPGACHQAVLQGAAAFFFFFFFINIQSLVGPSVEQQDIAACAFKTWAGCTRCRSPSLPEISRSSALLPPLKLKAATTYPREEVS